MAIDLNKIELRKKSVLDLKKQSGLGLDSRAQVVLALDFSGSMANLYRDGTVQNVVEKILPFGLAFDDNGEVDFYLFHNSYIRMKENITLANLDNYVPNKIIGKYSMGGTEYSPVLKAIHQEFSQGISGGKRFLGLGKPKAGNKMKMPVYIIMITDGDNYDKSQTEEIIRKMSSEGFFVQFIGIGSERFSFLDKLDNLSGRLIDNANLLKVHNINNITDDALYQGLMAEYPEWVKLAKSNNLID